MKVAICQPTYLPWLGYFDLMDQVDAFVLLDNVQFEKQSWQQRNRIKTPTGLQWLTVPVVFRGKLSQLIQDVEIRDPDFGRTHLRTIEVNYRKTRFFPEVFQDLSAILGAVSSGMRLADLNIRLLQWFAEKLKVRTPLVRASTLAVEGKRTGLLANICQKLGADQYVSPIGSAEYLLEELSVLQRAGVQTTFHNYLHPEYEQRFPPFVAFVSAIDLMFNVGERAMGIIRSGRCPALTPEVVAARMTEVKES